MKKVLAEWVILGMYLGSNVPIWAYDPAQLPQLKTTKPCPNCDLSRADLTQAFLGGNNLCEAQLQGVNLTGANQQGMNLMGAHRCQTLGLLSP